MIQNINELSVDHHIWFDSYELAHHYRDDHGINAKQKYNQNYN